MCTFDDDLIENVKKYPILYRNKGKKMQNMLYKENCWKEVAFALNRTPEECKTKWRNIRDSYKKNKKKKNTGAPTTVSKYDDERLKFLSESEDNGDPSSIEGIKEEFDTFEEGPLTAPTFTLQGPNEIYTIQPPCAQIITPNADVSHTLINSDPNLNSQEQKPVRRKGTKRKLGIKGSQDQNGYHEGASPTHKFFSSMADIVSKFPPDKIAEIRMRICNMVSEAELVLLTERSQTVAVPVAYFEPNPNP